MELDKRIEEGKTYLDCFDTEVAMRFIGKECYLSDGVASFANIDNLNKAVLIEVDGENTKPYTLENTRWRYSSNFILPCEWVKEPEEKPEKKYRPFTLTEWIDQHEIGEVIHYRSKSGEVELRHMYVGTRHSQGIKKIILKITLGNVSHTLDDLFEDYEIEINNKWQPFGVIDEDKE